MNTEIDIKLLQAVCQGDFGIAKSLIEKGANVNAVDDDNHGFVLGLSIVSGCDTEFVDYLLAKGADINLCPDEGWAAIYVATLCADVEMVRHLLSRGADPNMINLKKYNLNDTALDCAFMGYYHECVGRMEDLEKMKTIMEILEAHGGKSAEELPEYHNLFGKPKKRKKSGSTAKREIKKQRKLRYKGIIYLVSNDGKTKEHYYPLSGKKILRMQKRL